MNFLDKIFNRKKYSEGIKIIVDYVEGKLSINDFKKEFDNNSMLQKLLDKKLPSEYKYIEEYGFSLYHYFKFDGNFPKKSWDNIGSRYRIFENLTTWLDCNKIAYNATSKYTNDCDLLLDMQPSWLDIVDDQGIFDKIIAELPKDLSRPKQVAWGKAKIKELFRYDKTYPRWIQSPEWPIVNGKPLVFSHQKRAGKDDERTYYYFYDPDTKEETVVTQMY